MLQYPFPQHPKLKLYKLQRTQGAINRREMSSYTISTTKGVHIRENKIDRYMHIYRRESESKYYSVV